MFSLGAILALLIPIIAIILVYEYIRHNSYDSTHHIIEDIANSDDDLSDQVLNYEDRGIFSTNDENEDKRTF